MAFARIAGVALGDGFPVRVVGAINVSPESFYGGSVAPDAHALRDKAQRMVEEGAELLDLGAMSTAPYLKTSIDEEEERRRIVAAMRVLNRAVSVPISADTKRAAVAAVALAEGASVINDISGFRHDPGMAEVAAEARGVILMALEEQPTREPVMQMVMRLLRDALDRARAAGIPPECVVLDPGIGFHRSTPLPWHEVDCLVIRELQHLKALGRPLMVGISRKSFVAELTGRADPADRLWGSLAATAVAVCNGAALVRTHDVGATRDVVRVAERLLV